MPACSPKTTTLTGWRCEWHTEPRDPLTRGNTDEPTGGGRSAASKRGSRERPQPAVKPPTPSTAGGAHVAARRLRIQARTPRQAPARARRGRARAEPGMR
eukprot:1194793-Prorocentrum_minimum.AAC.4